MNELSEFFNSVAKEKVRVQKEKERFEPRVNINLSDLSGFFGTITEAKREHVVIAKRESTKLDALKGFFQRLDKFEEALQENIEKQKEGPKDGFDPTEVEGYEEFNKKYDEPTESEKKQEELEPIIETKVDRFPTAEERWPRAGETIKQVEIKPVNYFNNNKRPEPKVENTIDVNTLASQMSGLIKKPDEVITEQVSDLERLRLEFDKFRKLVNLQMASIGGGGETRLLKLDDVDTSSLGNGKFLVFNSTTNKLEFTDQIDGN